MELQPTNQRLFRFFHGEYDCEKRQHDIIKALNITAWEQNGTHFINLKISNKSAFLESENGKEYMNLKIQTIYCFSGT